MAEAPKPPNLDKIFPVDRELDDAELAPHAKAFREPSQHRPDGANDMKRNAHQFRDLYGDPKASNANSRQPKYQA